MLITNMFPFPYLVILIKPHTSRSFFGVRKYQESLKIPTKCKQEHFSVKHFIITKYFLWNKIVYYLLPFYNICDLLHKMLRIHIDNGE